MEYKAFEQGDFGKEEFGMKSDVEQATQEFETGSVRVEDAGAKAPASDPQAYEGFEQVPVSDPQVYNRFGQTSDSEVPYDGFGRTSFGFPSGNSQGPVSGIGANINSGGPQGVPGVDRSAGFGSQGFVPGSPQGTYAGGSVGVPGAGQNGPVPGGIGANIDNGPVPGGANIGNNTYAGGNAGVPGAGAGQNGPVPGSANPGTGVPPNWRNPAQIRKELRKKHKIEQRRRRKAERMSKKTIGIRRSTAAIAAVIAILVCAASGIGGGLIGAHYASSGSTPNIASGDSYKITPTSEMGTTEAVAKKVLDSVVGITSKAEVQDFFGQTGESSGVGTGMIVDANGYILTNSHVVMDGKSNSIKVLLSDGREVDAELLWYDSAIDLAIIKIQAEGLAPVDLGDSDQVQIGSYAAAIGNPLGLDFNGSITQGVVSGLNRSITASSGNGSNATHMEGLLQVDAAINSGNSGGPLLNNKGEVIGINTAKASAEGMGFAIPINTAKPIIERVIETGSFERVYMGVSAAAAATLAAQYPNLELGNVKGAFLTEVAAGSPADKAGLMMKDIITEVDGKEIASSTELIKTLLYYRAGDQVQVKYLRDGKEETTTVTLASQSDVYGEQTNPQVPVEPAPVEPDSGDDGSKEPFHWYDLIPGFGR